jgi:hypothetical protein
MIMVDIKCPYCFDWTRLTQKEFDIRNKHICMNCFHMFAIDDTVIEYLNY